AQRLANAGLDYYNHNLDTSPEFYGNIITTRRLASLRLTPRPLRRYT
ncbi:biotin synthase, partial [Salmonella enterica subsp. enterica serovar Agona str. 0292]